MNTVKLFNNRFEIDPLSVFMITLITVVDKSGSVPYFLVSSILHETGHISSILLLKGKITKIILRPFSLELERPVTDSNLLKDLIISISGVLVNFIIFILTLFVYKKTGNYAAFVFCISNFLILSYNLLPLSFLDGGEIVLTIEKMLFGIKTRGLISKCFHILTVILGIVSSMVFVKNEQILLAIFCLYPIILTYINKGKKGMKRLKK